MIVTTTGYRAWAGLTAVMLALASGDGQAQSRFPVPTPSPEAVAAAAAMRLVPLAPEDTIDTSRSGCFGDIVSDTGERLAVSAGSEMLVRLSVPFAVDNASKPPASPQVTFYLGGETTSSWGRYTSKGFQNGWFVAEQPQYSIVATLKVAGKTTCPAEAGQDCLSYRGTLELGYTPPDAPASDDDDDGGLYRVTQRTPAHQVTLRERCRVPNGRRYASGLLERPRGVLDTAAGILFFMMGGTR